MQIFPTLEARGTPKGGGDICFCPQSLAESMTWTIHVKKGPWVAEIVAVKKRMKDEGVSKDYIKRLESGNQSLTKYCLSLRVFAERVSSQHDDLDGMKNALRRLRALTNWAAHDEYDDKYGHTDVFVRHMRKTLQAFNTIADVLIAQEDSSSSDDLVDEMAALRL